MNSRIEALRQLFSEVEIDAYILPSSDEFLSEYTPDYLNRLKWLTGFNGSNGMVIVTKDEVYFFTYSRYLIAVEKQFGNDYKILDMHEESPWDFIKSSPLTFGIAAALTTRTADNIKYVAELVDQIWQRKKYNTECNYFIYETKYSGQSFREKLAQIWLAMEEVEAKYLIITEPDIICWLTNLRGNDAPHTPLILAYAIAELHGALKLYVYNETAKLPKIEGISIFKFDEFYPEIELINDRVMLDPKSTPMSVTCKFDGKKVFPTNPCVALRAIKNDVEIENSKQIHIIDAVSVCKLLLWIKEGITEEDVVNESYRLRAENDRFFSPSFETIAGFRGNGAIIHYHVTPQTNLKIEGDGLLLIDSGGQYFGGTTDITRTIVIGTPTKEQITAYTTVLKGHLALSNAVFERSTTGSELDKIARAPLLAQGMDYAHSTGHGVGNFLGVHECPPNIGSRASATFESGMIVSNEPGYYKEGEFGIRIENMVYVKELDNQMLAMEDLTLVPYDYRLIDFSLLTKEELQWLEQYYTKIKIALGPYFDEATLNKLCSISQT